MEDVSIKKSKIHGKGVFASRNFKKGKLIINWSNCTEILSKKDFLNLPKNEQRYVSLINKRYIHFLSPARFVNHSCNSNTKITKNGDIAKRDIKKGEEITTNYLIEKASGPEIKCNCGSKNCKKILKI
jgi:SET domain-containing protein